MKLMSSNMVNLQIIGAVATNKLEYDAQISDWFTRTGIVGFSKDTTRFNAAHLLTCSTKYDPQYCASSKGSSKSTVV